MAYGDKDSGKGSKALAPYTRTDEERQSELMRWIRQDMDRWSDGITGLNEMSGCTD